MSEEEIIEDINQLDYTEQDVQELLKELENDTGNYSNYDLAMAIIYYKNLYKQEKEKNKNKDKILRNIREEFLKYDWKNANPIQTYNQVKSLYEAIYLKPYED